MTSTDTSKPCKHLRGIPTYTYTHVMKCQCRHADILQGVTGDQVSLFSQCDNGNTLLPASSEVPFCPVSAAISCYRMRSQWGLPVAPLKGEDGLLGVKTLAIFIHKAQRGMQYPNRYTVY